ncbi:probable palmitoyltransferase ZDHHC24 [Nilaparvata lugens]|uniref:probable palmitoyltransferase ZDHHC24 n=1 Tax=Nilaparvata lugens TaxID=108931 RepID=UPI00193CCC68|nr:probable palmitoyltransferase ZDHHC24 [Nilaparvata lugens]
MNIMELMIRKQFLPQTLGDRFAFLFFILILPLGYWFTLFIVIPTVVPNSPVRYLLHFIWSTFLMISIVSNFVYLVLTDCNASNAIKQASNQTHWKYCAVCDCETPPRSWHCDICKICILKRDHHCRFSGCCIGHQNQRFFIMFLAYLSIGTLYSTCYILIFLWTSTSFTISVFSVAKMIFPMAVFVLGIDTSSSQLYSIMLIVNFLGLVLSSCLLIYHFSVMLKGAVMYENSHKIYEYDLGSWKENLKQVFGSRWYISWISPFIKSELPNNGADWESVKCQAVKCK